MTRQFVALFSLGFYFGAGPCLASCGPLLVSYIAGTQKNLFSSSITYGLFSLSRVLSYIIFGSIVFFLGQAAAQYSFGHLTKYLFIFAGIFIIMIGVLICLGRSMENALCKKASSIFLKKDAKTIILFGLISGIVPCAPLVSVVSYIGLISKSLWMNMAYSAAFGLGTIISPLFILALGAGALSRINLRLKEKYYRIFNVICGLVVIFLGVQLLRRAFNA
jgi:sulfite exporter TauE/SafE